jgi:hypothetical protein
MKFQPVLRKLQDASSPCFCHENKLTDVSLDDLEGAFVGFTSPAYVFTMPPVLPVHVLGTWYSVIMTHVLL